MTSARPTVLLVGDTLNPGGTEGQFTELACRLDKTRWDVEVACVRPEGSLRPRLEAAGFQPWHCGPASFRSPRSLGAIAALARRMRARGIEIVHSFDFYTNLLALPAARLAGVPAIIGSQRNLGNLRSPSQQMVHDLCLRLAPHVHVNSKAVKDRVLRSRGIQPEQVTVIPNGVDLGRFSPRNGRPRSDGILVGTLSNLRPEKGLTKLLQAVAMAREHRPEIRLVIWGEGSLRAELEHLATALNLAEYVDLPGTTDAPEARLRELDIFVLPSLSEACSNGLMEAMATALPVVATAVGGNLELVDDETSGLLVPPGDSVALAKAIIRLVEDRGWAGRMGEQARGRAHSMFGMERMVASIEALYVRALEGRES